MPQSWLDSVRPPGNADWTKNVRPPEDDAGLLSGAVEGVKQAGLGVVDSFGRAAEGVVRLGNAALPGQPLGDPEQISKFYSNLSERTAPTGAAGTVGRVAGNIVGEGLQYIGGGAGIRKVAGVAASRFAPSVAARMSKLPTLAKDALAVAPVDLVSSAVGPENSTVGALAGVTAPDEGERGGWAHRGLQWTAENPVTRFGSEVAVGMGADAALRGIGRMLRTDVSGDIAAGITEGAVPEPQRWRAPEPRPSARLEDAAEPMANTAVTDQNIVADVAEDVPGIAPRRGPSGEGGGSPARDLFGAPVDEPVGQAELLPEPRRGLSSATEDARATVSNAEGRVTRGQATPEERYSYDEARALLRSESGEGLDAGEMAGRASRVEEPTPPDEQTAEIFDYTAPEPSGRLTKPRGFGRAQERRSQYRDTYEKLDDEALKTRWGSLQRGMIRVAADAEHAPAGIRVYDNDGIKGVVGTGGGSFDRGRYTMQKDRIDIVEKLLKERGIDPASLPNPFQNAKVSDVMNPNRLLVQSLGQMDDAALTQEIRNTVQRWEADQANTALTERMTLLYAEAEKPGRKIDLEGVWGGFAVPAVVRALFGGSGGALAGAGVGAALDDESRARGALIGGIVGAGIGTGMGAAFRGKPSKGLSALERQYLANPSVAAVAQTIGQAPAATVKQAGLLDRAKNLGRWLRFKTARESLPWEGLEKDLTKGGATRVRDEMARARGWISSASLHMEQAFKPVLDDTKDVRTLGSALAKAERGLELAGLGKDTSPQQIQEWTATVNALSGVPEARKAVDSLRAYYRSLLDMKLNAGVLTQDQYDAIVQSGEYYVPFLPSEVAEFATSAAGSGRYAPNRSSGVRRMSDALNQAITVDPWEQAIVDTYETFDRVARQRVANTIGELVENFPAETAGLIERQAARPSRPPSDGKMVEAIVDGERRYYVVKDQDLLQSWTNFNKPLRSTALRAMSGMRRFMQAGVTGNPVFGLVNGIRDFMQSGVQYGMRPVDAVLAGGGAAVGAATAEPGERIEGAAKGAALGGGLHLARHLTRTLGALNDILGPQVLGSVVGGTSGYLTAEDDENGFLRFLAGAAIGAGAGTAARGLGATGNTAIYDEFVREGGAGFGFYARNIKDARKMQAALTKDGVSKSDFVNPKSWWEAIQYVSRAIETAPRLARYKELRGAGSEIGPAIFQARDLSLDFAVRPGSQLVRGVAETVPFLNPAIQGMDKLARMLADPKVGMTAAATIVAPTVTLWSMINEDPETAAEYQDRPLWERNTYWLIPKKWFGQESGFVRVPKPFELGFVYASLPERFLDYAATQNPEQLQFALVDAFGQYGPGNLGGLPMPLGPMYDVTRGEHGYDPFRRREINPDPWSNIPPELQYNDRTSTVGVALGSVTGTSPAKWDYAIRAYTGTLGSEALDQTSRMARAVGLDDRPAPVSNDRAFAGRFHTDPGATPESEQSIRRQLDSAEKPYQAVRELIDRGDMEAARTYATEHADELTSYYQLRPMGRVVDVVSQARRKIRENPELTSEEKADAIARLNGQVSRLMQAPGGR